ncbi:hypothetical protein LX15_002459 [Streptoalloteichus tenebrarius]|uniref:Integral membrane protein n=1 Tax=Streptoalloteichus tenebrarius (strain ATCC 17920 / DSM 40477 / JCM 4838 / CBS 697.72 / NBRC 16177 / NCIMB 11028 / NRRL B-12390 / A12253. 1 / ISP 5477) TaxID=1933 RepID=A0ABT1HTB0_STRSD|nr:hypothetical protein [Streptoalloteichus tenebrarius]MCP2258761.1 hypothetical protein [Streptoalloteichus tenebrarius]BFF02915.1 hypothetical protein GCM10020241_45900 [Streptoalloteichus tenebrarius]
MRTLMLSAPSRLIAGLVLLTVVTIEVGGWHLTRVAAGRVPLTDFQKAFARAGHAHAGVLVTLGLVCLVLADAARLDGVLGWVARLGVPSAAVLMSAGFFLSSLGRSVTRPNGLVAVLWVGAAALAAGVVTLGVGLLAS